MDSMIFVIIIFVSIFIAFGMLVIATTIRKLMEKVNQLKDENHSLKCSEQSLLWQRENLRNEIKRLVLDRYYWSNLKQWMHDEVMKSIHSPEFNKMEGVNRVERLEEETFHKHYKW